MTHAPEWLTWLIALLPILLVLGVVLYLWGADEPDNGICHEQEDEARNEDPDLMTAVA